MEKRSVRFRMAFRRGWDELGSNKLALIGLGIIVVFGLLSFVHPILMGGAWPTGTYNPLTGCDPAVVHPSSSSGTHLLGTDWLGRDILGQMLAGTRPTFVLATIAAVTTAVVATTIGAIGAYFRGLLDGVLSRFSDAMLLLPAPIFMVVIGSGEFSQKIGPVQFGLIYGALTGLGAGAIVLRSHALKIMASPYVDAARTAGGSDWWIIKRHLLPHLYPFCGALHDAVGCRRRGGRGVCVVVRTDGTADDMGNHRVLRRHIPTTDHRIGHLAHGSAPGDRAFHVRRSVLPGVRGVTRQR